MQSGTQKLVDLTSQWYSVQEPLLNQYRNITETLNANEVRILIFTYKYKLKKLFSPKRKTYKSDFK